VGKHKIGLRKQLDAALAHSGRGSRTAERILDSFFWRPAGPARTDAPDRPRVVRLACVRTRSKP
jgi:hypothetical protein